MTVQSSNPAPSYTGNGVTTTFNAPANCVSNPTVSLIDTVPPPGTTRVLTLGTDYTNNVVGGVIVSVTLTVAPTIFQVLSIRLNEPFVQLTHYVEGSPFPAASHEAALDKLTVLAQQIVAMALDLGSPGLTAAQIMAPFASALSGQGDALLTVLQPFDNAVPITQHVFNQALVSVLQFGAVGDGLTNDWLAFQEAHDWLAKVGGGTMVVPSGHTYLLTQNLIIWSSNICVSGYGATLKISGTGGEYGAPIQVLGLKNGCNYFSSGAVASATYSAKQPYAGATTPSVNIVLEGFRVIFGALSSKNINGIGGNNFNGLVARDVYVLNAPQTCFAFVANDADCIGLELDNCVADGYGVQGFRITSYTSGVKAGIVSAHMRSCRSINGVSSINMTDFPAGGGTIYTECFGVPCGLHLLTGDGTVAFDVLVDACNFDQNVNVLRSSARVAFRKCAMFSCQGFAGTATPGNQTVTLDDCVFTGYLTGQVSPFNAGNPFQVMCGSSGSGPTAACNWTLRNCGFVSVGNSQDTIINQMANMTIDGSTGTIDFNSVGSYLAGLAFRVERSILGLPTSGGHLTATNKRLVFRDCTVNAPITYSNTNTTSIRMEGCYVAVNSSFSTYVLTCTGNPVAVIDCLNNTLDWTGNVSYVATSFCYKLAQGQMGNVYIYQGPLYSYDNGCAAAAPGTGTGYWLVGFITKNSQGSTTATDHWNCITAGLAGASGWKAVAMS